MGLKILDAFVVLHGWVNDIGKCRSKEIVGIETLNQDITVVGV